MRIGTAEAKRIDTDHQPFVRVQRDILGGYLQVPLVKPNMRVDSLEVDGRRHRSVLQAAQHLGQSSGSRRRLEMPKIAFHRPNE